MEINLIGGGSMNVNPYYQPYWLNDDELEHFGIKGMKWGVRRYQNADGTLTEAGKKRLENYKFKEYNRVSKMSTSYERGVNRRAASRAKKGTIQREDKAARERKTLDNYKKELTAIKKLKYSDMEKELKIKKKKNLESLGYAFIGGAVGGVIFGSLDAAAGTDLNSLLQKSRLEIYEELNKKK